MTDFAPALRRALLGGITFGSIVIIPGLTFESVSLPKYAVLIFSGVVCLTLICFLFRKLWDKGDKSLIVMFIMFLSLNIASIAKSQNNLTLGLFGINGSNRGFVTFLAFPSFMLAGYVLASTQLNRALLRILIGTGFLNSLYGLVQILNFDPVDWTRTNYSVFGFMGNPNFHSTFSAITVTASVGYIFTNYTNRIWKLISTFNVPLGMLNLWFSHSKQGWILVAIGVLVIFLFLIKNKFGNLKFSIIALSIFISVMMFLIFDLLQIGFWRSLIYESSISYRYNYWRAAIRIGIDHLIFGIGPDGFRDQYRIYRDISSITDSNFELAVDATHNTFLDIFVNGGIILLLIFIAIHIKTLMSIHKHIMREKKIETENLIIISCWTTILAQGLISSGNLAINAWHWVLMGTIIGFSNPDTSKNLKQLTLRVSWRAPVGLTAGFIVALILAISPVLTDMKFISAFKSGRVERITQQLNDWPQSDSRMILASSIFLKSKMYTESELSARKAVTFNPNSYEAWKALYIQNRISEMEKLEILSTLRRLDPLNPRFR